MAGDLLSSARQFAQQAQQKEREQEKARKAGAAAERKRQAGLKKLDQDISGEVGRVHAILDTHFKNLAAALGVEYKVDKGVVAAKRWAATTEPRDIQFTYSLSKGDLIGALEFVVGADYDPGKPDNSFKLYVEILDRQKVKDKNGDYEVSREQQATGGGCYYDEDSYYYCALRFKPLSTEPMNEALSDWLRSLAEHDRQIQFRIAKREITSLSPIEIPQIPDVSAIGPEKVRKGFSHTEKGPLWSYD